MSPDEIDLTREAEFALGGLTVRPAVRQAGTETLEPRVMQVLVALARAGGEVVSRDQLIAACWGGRIVGEDAIQRCIARLRKLQETQGGFVIETLAKIGYRLTAAGAGSLNDAAGATLAVLPFVNMSSDPEQDYFSDGLSEELMTQLAQLKGLRVTGRTSVFAFKGRHEDPRTIGDRLGVAHILDGSVRKAGSRLRIAAQLIKCADGYHLWSQTYDRELTDVFAIQEEIAVAVSRALSVTLGLDGQGADYGGARSFEAYDQYLRGRILGGVEVDVAQLNLHADHLRAAVAIDPDYALAWADLANLLARLQSQVPAVEARAFDAERDHAAGRALALAPDLPAAHLAEGWRHANDRNWIAAEEGFRRAARLEPGEDAVALGVVGGFLSGTGRVREGLPLREAARDADPLALLWSFNTLSSYLTLGLTDRFEAEYRRSQGLQGDYRRRVEALRLTYLLMTRAEPADIEVQFERVLTGASPAQVYGRLSQAYADRDAALAVLRGQFDAPPRQLLALAELAGVYGDVDMAIQALSKAEPDVTVAHLHLLWRPALRATRRDPRFKELMHALGLAQFWSETGKWPDLCQSMAGGDFEFVG